MVSAAIISETPNVIKTEKSLFKIFLIFNLFV
jgi:hypothetical protein